MNDMIKLRSIAVMLCLMGAWAPVHAITRYVAVGGTGNGSSPATPMGSVNAAYHVSAQGDVIEMAAGTYDNQPAVTAYAAANSWTGNVTVQPASGATVLMRGTTAIDWNITGPRITFKGISASMRIKFQRGSNYGRLENCSFYTTEGGASVAISSDHCQVVDNFFNGAPGECDGLVIASGNATVRTKDTLVEGNVIKDYQYNPGSVHEDGIQIYDAEDIIIRNNIIANVANSCIILSPGAGSHINNVRIENNFLNKVNTNASTTADLRASFATNVVCINNTIVGGLKLPPEGTVGSVTRNNIIQVLSTTNSGEQYNYIYTWNPAGGTAPDATSHVGPLPTFVNAAANDLHISPANAVNLAFGNPTDAPVEDIDGGARTSPIWVGADQILPITYEAESIAAATATDAVTVKTDVVASNNHYELISANANGDYIEYTVPVTDPGTYNVKVRMMKHYNRGIIQLAVDGLNQGVVMDTYANPAVYVEFDLGNVTFATGGNKLFRFTVTGKNASSGGREFAVDYIKLSN